METRSAKRKKKNLHLQAVAVAGGMKKARRRGAGDVVVDDDDRLTDLPDDILHLIFSHLPIKSIAQTSVLSKRCKSLWHSFPDLDFSAAPSNFAADQISSLLDRRRSDLRALKFRSSLLTFSRLTALIRQAVKYNVRELDLEISTCDYFNIPRALIHSTTLKSLRLKSCHPGFRLPPFEIMRDAFRSLTVLTLSRPVFQDQDLFRDSSFPLLKKLHMENCFGMKRLRVECPALEDLCLESCFQLQDLEVNVGRLERLRVSSCFDPYCFGSRVRVQAPRLRVMVWSYNAVTDNCAVVGLTCMDEAFVGFFRLDQLLQDHLNIITQRKVASVRNFLMGISCCRSLTLESQCIEIISKSNPTVSLCPFNKLESLELSTSFNAHNNPGLASLFKSSPNVHTIVIKIIKLHDVERRQWNKDLWQSPSSGEERYWESQTQHLKSFLSKLKVVKIHGFTECANEISLVKFLLKNGKELQDLFLCTSTSSSLTPKDSLLREKIKSQIMGFSQASSNANIVFQ